MTNSTKNEISEEEFSKVLKKNPLKLLKEGGKFGVNGILKMITIVLLFSVVNIFIFTYFTIKGYETNGFLKAVLTVIVGFAFTIIAGYKTYRYIIINAFSSVYQHISPFFTKISEVVIHKSEDLLTGKSNLKNSKNSKAIDISKLLNIHYEKVPKFLKFGMTFIINRIPFVELLSDLKGEFDENNQQVNSDKLNAKMNTFVEEKIFNKNTTQWVYWLLPLNVIIQFVIFNFLWK